MSAADDDQRDRHEPHDPWRVPRSPDRIRRHCGHRPALTLRTAPGTPRAPRSRPAAAAGTASRPPSSGTAASRATRPAAPAPRGRSRRSRARATRRSTRGCPRNADDSATRAPSPSNAKDSTAERISLPKPAALERLTEPRPGVDGAVDREVLRGERLRADRPGHPARPSGSGSTPRASRSPA